EWKLPHLNVKRIKLRLKLHVHFEVKSGYIISGLPKFNDLTSYGPSPDEELQLWGREVERLVRISNSPDALQLDGHEDLFGNANLDGYNRLHKIAIQLQDALDVCIHDNEVLFMQHMPSQADQDYFYMARERLLQYYDPDQGKERFQRHLTLERDNDRYYHAIVNYTTGMMLRVLLRMMRGALWDEECVVTVAKFAAKLKLLLNDLPKSVSHCIAGMAAMEFRNKHRASHLRDRDYDCGTAPTSGGSYRRQNQRSQPDSDTVMLRIDAEMRYFIVMKTFHIGISRLLESALSNLSSNEDTEMSADVFDATALMYEDYITNRPLYLCSQRDGTIGAAADRRVMESTGAAFQVCLDAWESISNAGGGSDSLPKERTSISWKWTRLDPSSSLEPTEGALSKEVNLSTMKSVITAFVPHSMACGNFPSLLQAMSNRVSLISDPTTPIHLVKQDTVLAIFTIRTSEYLNQQHHIFDNDACNVTESAFARVQSMWIRRNEELKKMAKARKEFERWVIDEKSIIIPHRLYAWGFLGISATIVFGGLGIGLSVGGRIASVDPLGFASLCWVFAGFLLIVAKYLRVENWPWSRFFRGEVVCRSVSEVRSVTRMDPQIILALLLKFEPRMSLIKKGPYNAVFSKRGADGFAIDVPLQASTLMDGGVIPVKVQSVIGDALVGVRADLWTRYDSVSPKGDSSTDQRVICEEFSEPGKWANTELPLYTLTRGKLQWFRVTGLFNKDAFFK
ncbi:hypothetical protein GQ53DRAFT_632176, partial [Thozetella sp. PMI_491]